MIKFLPLAALFLASSAYALDTEIVGNVQSKCVIHTDKSGVYGNPTAEKLSTDPADGGVLPIIRYDVAVADYYTARITHPTSFSSSPPLSDSVTWTGETSVHEVSDAGMAGYDAAKVEYDATTEFDLSVAGTTWFKVASTATYGVGKAFPGGVYRAIVQAECIAN